MMKGGWGPVVMFGSGVILGQWLSMVSLGVVLGLIWIFTTTMAKREESLRRQIAERQAVEHAEALRAAARVAQTLRLSEREKVLIEELDCRTWIDELLVKIYSQYKDDLSLWLKNLLDETFTWLCPLGPILEMKFTTFDLGERSPRIRKVAATRLEAPDEVQLDVDVKHLGCQVDVELAARLGGKWIGMTLPLRLSSMSIDAVFRVRARMSERPPYIGILDIALAAPPTVFDFALKAVVELSGLPAVAETIIDAVKALIEDLMLWPKRISLPLDEWWYPTSIPPKVAHGVLRITVDRATALPSADYDGYSDPYVVLEVYDAITDGTGDETVDTPRETIKTAVKSKSLSPVWAEDFAFLIMDPAADKILFKLYDYDMYGESDLLGTTVVPATVLRDLSRPMCTKKNRALWLQIAGPKKAKAKQKLKKKDHDLPARMRVELSYGILAPHKADFKALDFVIPSNGDNDDNDDAVVDVEPPVAAAKEEEEEESDDDEEKDVLNGLHDDNSEDDDDVERKEGLSEEDLEEKTVHQLFRQGAVTLWTGHVRKQGFGGFRTCRKRWMELQLTLEYEPEVVDPLVAATLVYYRANDDEEKNKKNPHALGEMRLCSTAEVKTMTTAMFRSETQFEVKAHKKLWRIRCADKSETRVWTTMIERALRVSRSDRGELHRRMTALRPEPPSLVPQACTGASIVIEVIEARGLIGADDNGLCDPYVVATVGKQAHTTRVVKQTLAPRWAEYVEFWAGGMDVRPTQEQQERWLAAHTSTVSTVESDSPSVTPPKDKKKKERDPLFGGFQLVSEKLCIEIFDEDLGRKKQQQELLGYLNIPLVDLLPSEVATHEEEDDDHHEKRDLRSLPSTWNMFTRPSMASSVSSNVIEPPRPRWYPLKQPTEDKRRRHHRHHTLSRSFSGAPAPAGEILLRVTLRRFHVAKLEERHKVSTRSAQVFQAVADQAKAVAKGVQGGVAAAKKAAGASNRVKRSFKAAAHAAAFSSDLSRSHHGSSESSSVVKKKSISFEKS